MKRQVSGMWRWGELLGLLSQMSDLEVQMGIQENEPMQFVPDTLVTRWSDVFGGGYGLAQVGLSEEILAALLDFDDNLEQLVDIVPEDAEERMVYLRYDTVWRAIRELAGWTVDRIVSITTPETVEFSLN